MSESQGAARRSSTVAPPPPEKGLCERPDLHSDVPAMNGRGNGNGNGLRAGSALFTVIKWLVSLALVGGVVAAGAVWGPGYYRQLMDDRKTAGASDMDKLRFYTVTRKDLRIGVVEDGRLRATKHHNIQSKLDGRAKIAWVVEEGKEVKKGDKLIEFERKPVEEKIKKIEEEIKRLEGQRDDAEENWKIEESAGKSVVASAETRLENAGKALKKYKELDAPNKFKALQKAITDAERGRESARDALKKALETLDEHMFDEESKRQGFEKAVADKRAAVEGAGKKVASAILAKKMFQAYTYPEELQKRRQNLGNAKLELRKIRVAAKSNLQKCGDQFKRVKTDIKSRRKDLERGRKMLEECVLYAPAAGMVLYGDPRRRGWYSRGGEMKVEVGAEWYKNNTILTIPDFSKFEIDISVAEEYRGRVKPNCKALVTLEAVPGLKLEGKLKRISNLAQPRVRWDDSSPKVFKGIVQLGAADKRMVSGMTCRVEIVAEIVKSALVVPIEAVFNEDGKPVVYLRKGRQGFERREVQPGRNNEDFVQITGGLAEKDEIWLIHPHRAGLPVSAGAGGKRE